MKTPVLMSLFILFSLSIHAQIFKTRYNYLYPFEKKISIHFLNLDVMPMDKNFLNKELETIGIPKSRWLNAAMLGGKVKYITKGLYASISAHGISGNQDLNDTTALKLGFMTSEAAIGFNVVALPKYTFSPYIGLNYTHVRKEISLKKEKLPLEEYLKNRDIDLKIKQLSMTVGVNMMYAFEFDHQVFFYAAYVLPLHKNAWISSMGSDIKHNLGTPFKPVNFGFGYGYTFIK